jgi:uncharacterized protein
MDLSQTELRVLGSLVEKQLTTPQQYPLTLNALTLACNQTSNRDPVVSYDERTVESAVTLAKTKGLARFVHPSHGRSVIRYAHMLEEAIGIDRRQLCILAVLMLRGPQTPGELRSRTDRMETFESLSDIEDELDRLARREDPLVVKLTRRPGQKEERYAHLLGATAGADQEQATRGDAAARPAPPASPSYESTTSEDAGSTFENGHSHQPHTTPATDSSYEALERSVSELKEEVASLRAGLEELRSQLGG